ncbi:unnamed protein product [Chrysoparadoxa australica]
MNALANRRILLGVTGGIAAYKSAVLTRRLVEAGAEVQVVMTEGACRFITPLTLQVLSGRAVRRSLWDESAELGMGHIELARWAERVLIAPATADCLARLVQGRADDLLSTLCLATTAPVLVAPAMNHVMWAHPATRANCETLAARGVTILGPDDGELAERESGAGRMLEPEAIRDALAAHLAPQAGELAGRHVLITAGPTREPLDPVRYLTNRSSGRMGYALAAACVAAGARVTLVTGPTDLPVPDGVEAVPVETADDMHAAVFACVEQADVFIAAAAVADYRPAHRESHKIKKDEAGSNVDLVRNRDILAEVAAARTRPFVVGFAAETRDLEAQARAKRVAKGADMLAGNLVGVDRGFDQPDNAFYVCWEGGDCHLPQVPKTRLADQLVQLISQRLSDAQTPDSTA